jgi:glucokinase
VAADVGGTKTTIGVVTGPPWDLGGARPHRAENARHESFGDLLAWALAEAGTPPVDVACIAVAGPVIDGAVSMTNLDWVVRADAIERATGARRVRLLNDLEATALGGLVVPAERTRVLQAGAAPAGGGHVVAIAPGTGLGEAILCWDGAAHLPVASEGGHVDFAPRGDLQTRLLGWLAARHGHVSYERILSGPGLVALHEFLREADGARESPEVHDLAGADPAAAISRAALEGSDPLCVAALDLFVRILGAKAGNLALEAIAFGGVLVAGGIPGQIVPALTDGRFLEAFLDKGRHRHLLERMPVTLVLEPDAAWLGAATFGIRLAQ